MTFKQYCEGIFSNLDATPQTNTIPGGINAFKQAYAGQRAPYADKTKTQPTTNIPKPSNNNPVYKHINVQSKVSLDQWGKLYGNQRKGAGGIPEFIKDSAKFGIKPEQIKDVQAGKYAINLSDGRNYIMIMPEPRAQTWKLSVTLPQPIGRGMPLSTQLSS
jgi:hypothetical protein